MAALLTLFTLTVYGQQPLPVVKEFEAGTFCIISIYTSFPFRSNFSG